MTQEEYSNRIAQLHQLKHMQSTFVDNDDPYEALVVTDPDPDINKGIQDLIHAFDSLIVIIQEKVSGGQEKGSQKRGTAARRIA